MTLPPRKKVALVSSIGGHLTELLELSEAFADHDRVWILNDRSPVLPEGERAFVVSHAERDWRVVWNLFEFAALLARERPDLVASTGAGPAVPAALIAKLLGLPYLHIEPSSAVEALTLTGRLLRRVANRFYVQWEGLARKAPGARYVGGLL
jgi:hypothetical protein